jgi:hypothetical protein
MREVDRLARAGAGPEEISKALEVSNLARWEAELVHIYARGVSQRSFGASREQYLASLEHEIGA